MKETRFKQTEIGLIPEDWEISKLGEKCLIYRGGSPRPIENYITNNADGINWIKIGDVESDSKYIIKTKEKIKQEGVIRSRAVYDGDLILSNSMSFGRPYILKINGCIHDGWLVIQEYIKNFDLDYLYYLLGSAYVFRQYTQMAAGSSVQNLNKDKVSSVIVSIPTKKEQNKIASALTSIDNLLLSLDKLIEKKRLIKQGAMQELLTGMKRLPGFTGEWVERRLGDVGKIIMGQSPSSEFYNNNQIGLPLIQGNADLMNRKQIIRIYTSYITKTCNTNDIILSVRAPVGSVGKATMRSCIGRGVCCLKNKEEFLFQYLVWLEDKWDKYTTGSTFDSISTNELINIPILIPEDIHERTSIANILSSMDKEIESLEGKKAKYEQIKQGMMQQLLTGKIRLI